MNKPFLIALAVATLGAGGIYASVRLGKDHRSPAAELATVESEPVDKHRVTTDMLTATGKMSAQAAPPFQAKGTDGVSYSLADLAKDGPVVLAFIKHDCPCSKEAQRYFNRLADAYGREVKFLGVIDVDAKAGRAWGQSNATTFPLLADPTLEIVHAYHAESSAYLAVIAKGGAIDQLYPGYSEPMLAEVSQRLARLAGAKPRTIDASGAPDDLYTGCPF